ncbi:MAG: 23S rRNA (uracil(1939)-C(5))-methyltransferase RlmD, partial [Eggerthellaceae bacterium]|nr:23S rRNA (uracil(1939)-C(5))-methyltransferase RlmD [Eggerthellaceae bacterium]
LRQTNVILGQEEHTIYGPGFIIDTLCGLSFRISSHSFYQVNSKQTEVLYRTAVQFAGLADDNAEGSRNDSITVLDAYCGTGTIGLIAAAASGRAQVIGVDSVDSAIRDARANAAHNGIENAEFVTADAGAFMKQCAAQNRTIDVLMMDPPRAGASEDFLDAVNVLSPGRIVYISCNPTTQARDVEYLRTFGYRPMRIRPVDMFPHTSHVENVVLLEREAKLS